MKRRESKKLSAKLDRAARTGDTRTATALLRSGADGTAALYTASVQDELAAVRVLLTAGADPDVENTGVGADGTPLCAAACWGHTDVVRELLAHGADPGLREERGNGRTPLEWALAGPYPETVALLSAALEPSVPLDAQRQ